LDLDEEKVLVNIYQKIGNIAQQIQSLRELNLEKPQNLVGGVRIENQAELDRLIEYQWSRLNFLKSLPSHELFPNLQFIRDSISVEIKSCNECHPDNKIHVCEQHFFINSYISLIELVQI